MSRQDAIDRDREVMQIAQALGIVGPDLQAKLVRAATDRVQRQLDRFHIEPVTLDDVHQTVLNMTGVKVERLEEDVDLERVSADLAKTQPILPVQLELEFGSNTEALVFRHDHDPRRQSFTAVVDARGDRRFRAWFAERHEPAHLLVPDPSGRLAWRRTTAERPEPVEQVIDAIASEIGFWPSITRPVVERCLFEERDIFVAFDRARGELAPSASREACYRAFCRYLRRPIVLIRSDLSPRVGDRRAGRALTSLALRVQAVILNDEARTLGIV